MSDLIERAHRLISAAVGEHWADYAAEDFAKAILAYGDGSHTPTPRQIKHWINDYFALDYVPPALIDDEEGGQ